MGRRGEILVENLIFIMLNLIFLSILTLFLLKQGSGAIVLEESYAKQIALLIDSAKPGALIKLNMEKGIELARENNVEQMMRIDNNLVTIKLSKNGGYSYSFFNEVDVDFYKDKAEGLYVFVVNEK
ncbi:hypothetical protein HOD88_02410 [archaeon]|jgi:hypothetical protein|nr:hypothetical protein [archaeon]